MRILTSGSIFSPSFEFSFILPTGRQVITLRFEEEVVEEEAGGLEGGRFTGAHPLVELHEGLVRRA